MSLTLASQYVNGLVGSKVTHTVLAHKIFVLSLRRVGGKDELHPSRSTDAVTVSDH